MENNIGEKGNVVIFASKYHNISGIAAGSSRTVHRVHSDPLGLPPENYIQVSPFPRENQVKLGADRDSKDFFYENVVYSDKVLDLVDRCKGSDKGFYFLDYYSSNLEIRDMMEGAVNLGVEYDKKAPIESKSRQYDFLDRNGVLLPDFVNANPRDAVKYFDSLNKGHGVFASYDYGSGGSGVCLAGDKSELERFVDGYDGELLMVEGLPLKNSFSIDLLIANEEEIYPFGLSESLFSDSNKLGCIGSICPSSATPEEALEIYSKTKEIGGIFASAGVKGIVNIDYNVTRDGEIFFGEINYRPGASTGNKVSCLEGGRPGDVPSVMDLLIESKKGKSLKEYLPDGNMWSPAPFYAVRKRILIPEGTFHGDYEDFASHKNIYTNDESSIIEAAKEHGYAWGVIGLPPEGMDFRRTGEVGKLLALGRTSEEAVGIADKVTSEVLNRFK